MMPITILKRTMKTVSGRNGHIESLDRNFVLELSVPVEMGGIASEKSNPEELFAAGYSACFASSMEYILKSAKIAYTDLFAEVSASLIKDVVNPGFKFACSIRATISGVDESTKASIIHQAYAFCPYSRAIRNNVDVNITIL